MEYFHQGNNHYIDEDYDDAEIFYSKAISEYENSVKQPQQQQLTNNNDITITTTIFTNELLSKIYLHRGTTYLKLKKYYQALEDYNVCIRINLTIEIVYYRKGLTYFELEEYESAKECFMKGLDLLNQIHNVNVNTNTNNKHSKRDINSYIRYIRKCDVEIKGRFVGRSQYGYIAGIYNNGHNILSIICYIYLI